MRLRCQHFMKSTNGLVTPPAGKLGCFRQHLSCSTGRTTVVASYITQVTYLMIPCPEPVSCSFSPFSVVVALRSYTFLYGTNPSATFEILLHDTIWKWPNNLLSGNRCKPENPRVRRAENLNALVETALQTCLRIRHELSLHPRDPGFEEKRNCITMMVS